jgi:hypothetical protein
MDKWGNMNISQNHNLFKMAASFVIALLIIMLSVPNIAEADTSLCGTISTSTTLTTSGSPYIICSSGVTISTGRSLTIDPGVVVKFESSTADLLINGTLNAVGTPAQPIVFTSIKDDTIGGDTNGDENASTPVPGDWDSVELASGSSGDLQYVEMRYGGASTANLEVYTTGSLTLQHDLFSHSATAGVYTSAVSPTISDSIFRNNAVGLKVWTAQSGRTISLSNNTFEGNSDWNAYVFLSSTRSDILVSGSQIVSGPAPAGLWLRDDQRYGSGSMRLAGDPGFPFLINYGTDPYSHNLTVYAGTTLQLDPGTIMKFMGTNARLTVNGALNAVGTATQPIVFTSIKDDTIGGDTNGDGSASAPAPGDWDSVQFTGNASSGEFNYAHIYYGGASGSTPGNIFWRGGTIRNSKSGYSAGSGIVAQYSVATILECAIFKNARTGLSITGGTVSIHQSLLYQNAQGGVNNLSQVAVDATQNWWGTPSGPYHPTTNPSGGGNSVSDRVSYKPWLFTNISAESRLQNVTALTFNQITTARVENIGYRDYSFEASANQTYIVEINVLHPTDDLAAFSRLGNLPEFGLADQTVDQLNAAGKYVLIISPIQAGTNYLTVYGRRIIEQNDPVQTGAFQIVVREENQYLGDVSPRKSGNAGGISLTLFGWIERRVQVETLRRRAIQPSCRSLTSFRTLLYPNIGSQRSNSGINVRVTCQAGVHQPCRGYHD